MSFFPFNQPFSGVVRHLIILNVLVFIGSYVFFGSEVWSLTDREYTNLGRLQLAAYMPGSENFRPFQLVTHMFMHGDLGHLAFNMLSLFFFGPMVEMVWGHKRFLFYYLFCGFGSLALHFGVQWWELDQAGIDPRSWDGAMLGASGAIFGIFVAFAYMFPNQIIRLLFPPIAMKAKYFVLIMAVLELFYGVRGYSTGIAHFAHLGGALFGFLLIMIWYKGRFQ
ncbi:MAG: rhomboid family intramembrane serine protease [Lewinellaceae bacterium]|nr:rhomboid family intramembrane serine protease [Lewinellaceae bacterium]